jgi:hypothetical protein
LNRRSGASSFGFLFSGCIVPISYAIRAVSSLVRARSHGRNRRRPYHQALKALQSDTARPVHCTPHGPVDEGIDALTERIIGCGMEVHRTLGRGLLESVYRDCMVIELSAQNLRVETECRVSLEDTRLSRQFLNRITRSHGFILQPNKRQAS